MGASMKRRSAQREVPESNSDFGTNNSDGCCPYLFQKMSGVRLWNRPRLITTTISEAKECLPQYLVSPTYLYAACTVICFVWVWNLLCHGREQHRLRVFEHRVLRKIFGSERAEVRGGWKIVHYEELHGLYCSSDIIFLMARQPLGGLGRLIFQGFTITLLDTPHSVGLLWTSDQPVAETSTWQHTTLTRDRHPCPRRDSNPQSQ
jgi:hypothetical protein